MSKVKSDLKPCPFCGNKDIKLIPTAQGSAMKIIYCSGCGISCDWLIASNTNSKIHMWNKRYVKPRKRKKEWTAAQAREWALDHIS